MQKLHVPRQHSMLSQQSYATTRKGAQHSRRSGQSGGRHRRSLRAKHAFSYSCHLPQPAHASVPGLRPRTKRTDSLATTQAPAPSWTQVCIRSARIENVFTALSRYDGRDDVPTLSVTCGALSLLLNALWCPPHSPDRRALQTRAAAWVTREPPTQGRRVLETSPGQRHEHVCERVPQQRQAAPCPDLIQFAARRL